jgi:2-keto-4-pentenoate hydratase/2-oxohepta-3-ene-1,7-dioic acid hydratase in catechol pathway
MQLVTFRGVGSGASGGGPRTSGLDTLEYAQPSATRLGALIPTGPRAGDVVDLNRALCVRLAGRDVGAPEAEADSLVPGDLQQLLEHGDAARELGRETFRWALASFERFDGPELEQTGALVPRRNLRLCAPIPRPGKLIGVLRNYPKHAAERGAEGPEEPVLFIKASSSVIGTGDAIELPAASEEVDYEGELAVVIGTRARGVSIEAALDHVAGYTIANDVTARDYQHVRGQRLLGKSCDTFGPLGPALVTGDEIVDPQKLSLRTRVSGELRQSANTSEMSFSVAELIAFASRLMTLEPGDVILTGTPDGVGAAAQPPRFLREGDVVEVEIEGLGRLCNHVTAEAADS